MSNRYRHSKMISNSLIMVYFFYIILAALTKGFLDLLLPGVIEQHILLIPIVFGYLGFSWGIFNLSYETTIAWPNAKKVTYLLIAGTVTFLLSQAILILAGFITEYALATTILTFVGIALFIISNPIFAAGFFLFRKDLKPHYFNKYIAKFPNLYISISYLVLSLGIIFLLIAGLNQNIVGSVFMIGGIVTVVISILGLGFGFYPLFISFRAYPKILEVIEEAQMKKNQSSSKEAKKAS